MDIISERIHNRRKELDYTLQEAADKTGVAVGTFQKWEAGDIKNMKVDKIRSIAKALEVSPMWLMGWDDDPSVIPNIEVPTAPTTPDLYEFSADELDVYAPNPGKAVEEHLQHLEDKRSDAENEKLFLQLFGSEAPVVASRKVLSRAEREQVIKQKTLAKEEHARLKAKMESEQTRLKAKMEAERNAHKERMRTERAKLDIETKSHRESGRTIMVPKEYEADFFVRAKDDSMINARIFNGDLVFINKRSKKKSGDIIAVLYKGEAILRRVYKYEDRIELRAENPTFPVINLEGEEKNKAVILGKAVAFMSEVK